LARALAFLALLGGLVGWYEGAPHLGSLSQWPTIVLIGFVLMPLVFLLVWLVLPLWNSRWLAPTIALGPLRIDVPVGLVFVALAIVFSAVHYPIGSNFCKLLALTLLGWWFLTYFEALSWVLLVALLIPWVDAYSVWRGPTKQITEGHAHVFGALSVAFVAPGGAAARLGLPDVLFFAVFLAASARFGLRPAWTFVGMLIGLALTMVIATWWNVNGLPALPGISLGFILPNADLLRDQLRASRSRMETDST
jgi:hypothetical protein